MLGRTALQPQTSRKVNNSVNHAVRTCSRRNIAAWGSTLDHRRSDPAKCGARRYLCRQLISGQNFDVGGRSPMNLDKSIPEITVNSLALGGIKRNKATRSCRRRARQQCATEHSQAQNCEGSELPHTLLISNSFHRSSRPTLLAGSVSRSTLQVPPQAQESRSTRARRCI